MQGAPLFDLQMVQGHIADMALDVDASALLIYRAAWTKDSGAPRITREAAMAKLFSTEQAQKVIDTAVQLHGGDGVKSGQVVERLYRDIRALRIYEGASGCAESGYRAPDAGCLSGGLRCLDQRPIPIRLRATTCHRRTEWPDFLLDGFDYPDRLNAGVELTDAMVARGFGDNTALIGNGRRRTYKELSDWTNRLAHALVEDLGVKPGNRVLIRSANNPAMVACWLAATKAGAVVVNTMPMLRAGELGEIVDKAQITHALCDTRLMDEMAACAKNQRDAENRRGV